MSALSNTQSKSLLKLHLGDDGVQIREPTKLALIRMGYAYREDIPNVTNGWRLRLTEKGRDYCEMVRAL